MYMSRSRRSADAARASSICSGLWLRPQSTVAAHHSVPIATMLRKMEDKGVVAHRADGRQFVYRPVVSEDQVRRSMVGELVERLFGGDPKALVAHLVSENEIEAGELEALRRRLGPGRRRGRQ